MKKTYLSIVLIVTLGLITLSACGGGGGGGGSAPAPAPTSAVVTLSTVTNSVIPATTTINFTSVTITLPSGVTVKTMPSSSETGTGVVVSSGSATGADAFGLYTAATASTPGTVKVTIFKLDINGIGFNPGEFCKVYADIAAGHSPAPSSFSTPTLDDISGFDTLTSSTVTTALQAQLSLSASVVLH
jgi:hypothetical protein